MAADHRLFFSVERSITGRAWRDRLDQHASAGALTIAQRHGVPELLARIVAGRGVALDKVDAFLDPTVKRLMPDPDVVTDMAAAAGRLAEAIERREPIAIFGDYDVDGATSAAVLARFLHYAGIAPRIYIPDRLFEGYGPNVDAIRSLAASGTRLLVTVDCGTTSFVPLSEARALGLDVIVIDHHQADARLPPAIAVVNPNRLDDLSGLGHLAAVGLAFLAVAAINRELRRRGFWNATRPEPDLRVLLDLVALGTIADVARLEGLNRAFVAKGLMVMRRREDVGLTALMDIARLAGPPEPWHLAFLLAPRINSGGRIGRADLGVRLLLERDPPSAAAIAVELDRLNRERQLIEQAAYEEAEALAVADGQEGPAVLVTAAPNWHPGIVGLVAARLKERFGRPAFAIAIDPAGTATGSGRSIPGVDLGSAVRSAVAEGILIKGGGHAMAAGVTLARERLPQFRSFLQQALASAVEVARRDNTLLIDAALTAAGAGAELVATIARAGPFGAGNPEPVFALPSHTIVHADEVGQGHVRVRLKSADGANVQAIAFRAAGQPMGQALLANRGRSVHVAGALSVDHRQGDGRTQVRLLDLALSH
ncbi:MAG TPA: single-stranded-DNA-specific exonuclease RecJ [Xanthobacteraceae bacterium]|nr:single-stranded-DNA-specific exonuclease RecJ [Xanthobacteraceae bacterium]